MSNHILFVFEGEKTEKQITQNLKRFFINENTVLLSAFCADIYQLHKQISSDEDLDIFMLLKEKLQNSEVLSKYNRDDFAEIYLFFDYDGHATSANDEKIEEILHFFNEETSSGKLFISYPMVEALKHYSNKIDFKELKIKAKENIGYKQVVGRESQNELQHINKYTIDIWIQLIDLHLKKMNYITYNSYVLPKECISQKNIFAKQLENYINIDSTVAVLSSFPIFLFDYYGHNYISKLLSENSRTY